MTKRSNMRSVNETIERAEMYRSVGVNYADLLKAAKVTKLQLERANKIIGWMMPYIGKMSMPANGLFDLNIHCCENIIPEPGEEAKGRPINQRPQR